MPSTVAGDRRPVSAFSKRGDEAQVTAGYPVVWVESPLQFVSAAELAAERGIRLRVVFRLGPQMSQTAAELLARGADFGSCTPYLGIPWRELAGASEWIYTHGYPVLNR